MWYRCGKCVGVWGEVMREVWRSVGGGGVRKSALRCGGDDGKCGRGEGRVVGVLVSVLGCGGMRGEVLREVWKSVLGCGVDVLRVVGKCWRR